jgi:hypothetical protein
VKAPKRLTFIVGRRGKTSRETLRGEDRQEIEEGPLRLLGKEKG